MYTSFVERSSQIPKEIMLIDTINRHQVFIKQKVKNVDLLSLEKNVSFKPKNSHVETKNDLSYGKIH